VSVAKLAVRPRIWVSEPVAKGVEAPRTEPPTPVRADAGPKVAYASGRFRAWCTPFASAANGQAKNGAPPEPPLQPSARDTLAKFAAERSVRSGRSLRLQARACASAYPSFPAVRPSPALRPTATYSGAIGNDCFTVCAVTSRRFPAGASPTREPLQPEATRAVMEVTKAGPTPIETATVKAERQKTKERVSRDVRARPCRAPRDAEIASRHTRLRLAVFYLSRRCPRTRRPQPADGRTGRRVDFDSDRSSRAHCADIRAVGNIRL
jgi:hypothetical protein